MSKRSETRIGLFLLPLLLPFESADARVSEHRAKIKNQAMMGQASHRTDSRVFKGKNQTAEQAKQTGSKVEREQCPPKKLSRETSRPKQNDVKEQYRNRLQPKPSKTKTKMRNRSAKAMLRRKGLVDEQASPRQVNVEKRSQARALTSIRSPDSKTCRREGNRNERKIYQGL